MRSESVSGRARRTARSMATIPYPAPSAPSLALCARPALSTPLSPSLLPLSAQAVLPSLSFQVSYLFRPARALFSRPCRPSLHDTTQAHSTLHLWGRAALWLHSGAPRLAQCPRRLRAARSVVGHHVTPFSAPPSRSLCPPASACTVRSNSRGSAPSLPLSLPRPPDPVLPPVCSPSLALPCPPSLVAGSPASFLSVPLPLFSRLLFLTPAPRPALAGCGAIREATLPPCPPPLLPLPGQALSLVCSFSLVLPCSPSLAPGSLALCLLVPVLALPSLHTHRGAIREASLPLPLHLTAPWRPGPWACGTHVALHPPAAFVPLRPPCLHLPLLPFYLSTPRRTLRRTLCRQVARMSQARTWPSLHDALQDTAPLGLDRFVAARRGAPPCPVPPRTAAGSLGCGAPLCFCPTFAPSCRRGTPSSLPCLLCSSALQPARAGCGAIREAAPPLCPLSLPRPPGPVLPPVCSPSLVLPCLPSQVTWSLALCLSVPVLPLPSRHTLRAAIREAPLPLSLHLAAPWSPGPVCTRLRPVALYSRPTSLSLPCPFPSLHFAGHYAGHYVGKSHACRRHAPGLSLPALPFPLSTLRRTLRRTLCRHVARMSQARTWPLSAASSGWLAPRCGRPPLPQPLQMPRGARPW